MPIVDPGAKTANQMMAAGGGNLAYRLVRQGASAAAIDAQLRMAFPASSKGPRDAVQGRVALSISSAAYFSQSATGAVLALGAMPINPGLPERFRWTGTVYVQDAGTGLTMPRPVACDSHTNLTLPQVRDCLEMSAQHWISLIRRGTPGTPPKDVSLIDVSIDRIERSR